MHPCLNQMSWQIDGRNGIARVGESQRKGFALMRDQERHRIAFHVVPNETDASGGPELTVLHQFVIGDDDFEPSVA